MKKHYNFFKEICFLSLIAVNAVHCSDGFRRPENFSLSRSMGYEIVEDPSQQNDRFFLRFLDNPFLLENQIGNTHPFREYVLEKRRALLPSRVFHLMWEYVCASDDHKVHALVMLGVVQQNLSLDKINQLIRLNEVIKVDELVDVNKISNIATFLKEVKANKQGKYEERAHVIAGAGGGASA